MKGEYEKRLRRALDEQKSDFEKDMEQTALLAKVHMYFQFYAHRVALKKNMPPKKSLSVCKRCHDKEF